MAIGQFDIGPAAAFSLIYYLIVLLVCYAFFTAINQLDKAK
jgi:glycerol transport system permease protein